MKVSSILTITAIFVLVLIPSLHVPHLSDDYFYMAIANLHDQLGHYKEWSGRIVTNIFSAYMMKYASHTVYMSLNAMAFTSHADFFPSMCSIARKIQTIPYGDGSNFHSHVDSKPCTWRNIILVRWIC